MIRRTLAAALAALALAAVSLTASPADAAVAESGSHPYPYRKPLEIVPPQVTVDPDDFGLAGIDPINKGRAYVTFTDGRTLMFWACRYEDSTGCYWNGRTMGNGGGRTYVEWLGNLWYKNGQIKPTDPNGW